MRRSTIESRTGRTAAFTVLVGISAVFAAPAPAQDLSAEAVEDAIARGANYLKARQDEASGEWEEYSGYKGGTSALCTLALLNAGYGPEDDHVAAALRHLRTTQTEETYSVALQTMALCEAGRRADLPIVRRNVQWLQDAQVRGGGNAGGWSYRRNPTGGDPSNSQFAVLALDAAEQFGVPVDPSVWERAEEYWVGLQRPDGSWGYVRSDSGTGSMTCAGIGSLVIIRGRLPGEARVEGETVACCGATPEEDPVERGMQWLARNFSVVQNPGGGGRAPLLYYLYAMERVGRLTGRRLIGNHDWYREGATVLLQRQDKFQDYWQGVGLGEGQNRNVATSFALLFLGKGKRQVVLNRGQYGADEDWRHHPASIQQLVRGVQQRWGRDLTWQTARLEDATLEDLLQAPVLHLSGTRALALTRETQQLLKDYVEQGGFIFAEATAGSGCGSPDAFERSVSELAETLFDQPLERLPPDHPLWIAERPVEVDDLPDDFWLYGVQACCRTALVYSPISLTCRWELSDPRGRSDYPARVADEIDAAVAVGENVLAYATGRKLKDKLEQSVIVRPEEGGSVPRGTLLIPRLALGAGGEDAPRALPNLLEWMRQGVPARVTSQARVVGAEIQPLREYALVFAHGRNDFRFTDEQIEGLRDFFDGGGTLIAASVCGDEAFSRAFRRQLARVLPDSPLEPLPPTHPAFTNQFGGYDVTQLTLRRPGGGGDAGLQLETRTSVPIIEAARLGDRIAVLFSPYDISCALENQNALQCPGYETDDAARLGINLILFSLQQ